MPKISHVALERSRRDSYSPWQPLYLTSFPLDEHVEDTHILAMSTQNDTTELCLCSEQNEEHAAMLLWQGAWTFSLHC